MISFLERTKGVRLAFDFQPGTSPTIVFLPGYRSDMQGAKATALSQWAKKTGQAMLRFDYAGCGESDGDFTDCTLEGWRDDALHLINTLTKGPLILVGSSMGGWLALLIALASSDRVAAIVGLAAAPDFTEWAFSEEDKAKLIRDGQIQEDSADPENANVITRAFWESGQKNLLLKGPIDIDVPVYLLQGLKDDVVPWFITLKLADAIVGHAVSTTLIKEGTHRLSRDPDINLLIDTVSALAVPRVK